MKTIRAAGMILFPVVLFITAVILSNPAPVARHLSVPPPPPPAIGYEEQPLPVQPGADSDARILDREVFSLHETGPVSERVDIFLLGDGYTEADNQPGGIYEEHARRFMQQIFETAPFSRYRRLINIRRISCFSRERGADPTPQDSRDTLFDSAYGNYGIARLLVARNKERISQHLRSAGNAAEAADILIVLVNTSNYGGAGDQLRAFRNGTAVDIPMPVYAAGHPAGIRIALHELGHALANLADEYVDETIADIYGLHLIADKPNVDTVSILSQIKWYMFFRYPMPRGLIGAFEGGYYRGRGVYRPQAECMMRSLEQAFCHVCRKELARALFRISALPFDEHRYHRETPIQ